MSGLSEEQKTFIRNESKRVQGTLDTVTVAKRLGVPWVEVVEFLAADPRKKKGKMPQYALEVLKLKRMEKLWMDFHARTPYPTAPARARKAIEAQRDVVSSELLKLTLEYGGAALTQEIDAVGDAFQRMLEGKRVK